MTSQSIIFFGRSGSGKGTQASLLIEYIKAQDSQNKVIYVETGERLRHFVKTNKDYAGKLVDNTISNGGLMPAFFPIWLWSGLLIDELHTGKEHLIFDGVSRRANEAPVLDSALQFLKREKPAVLLLNTSAEEARVRLLKRGRSDDQEVKITERMRWFDTDVMPAVSYFEKNSYYNFVKINGNGSIEEVFEEIKQRLKI